MNEINLDGIEEEKMKFSMIDLNIDQFDKLDTYYKLYNIRKEEEKMIKKIRMDVSKCHQRTIGRLSLNF